MHVQHENRSGKERRQYYLSSLSLVGIERRTSGDKRGLLSDDDIDESEITLSGEYWAEFFSATMDKTRARH